MKQIIPVSLFLILFLTQPAHSVFTDPAAEESFSGAVVCEPDAYLSPPDSCLVSGPSNYLTTLAQFGITFPLRPLPALKPDIQLTQIPYRYFHLDRDSIPFYPSLADAEAKSANAQIYPPGFVYISYKDRVDTGRGVFYLTQSNYWIPGKGERVSEISGFQGLLFRKTPRVAFGWTFELIPIKNAPGYGSADSGLSLQPWTVIQVFHTQITDGAIWNMIGPDQWVEGRKVAIVTPSATPPEGVTNGRWIDVNLEEQTLAVYENNQLIFASMIASGAEPFWTRPGLHQIYLKKAVETMRNNDPTDFYYLEDVPYTMYFDGARALHAAYWRTRFGYPQSHGCVNLSVGDARWLFDWAREGDWVFVHDPSGQTPTDPARYSGGAY